MTVDKQVTMPDLGEGLTESDLVEWTVAVGDTVTLNQVVAEVETAKALVQLPCPFAGVVSSLEVEPGTTVAVGAPIMTIAVEDRSGAEPAPQHSAPSAPVDREVPVVPERTSVLVGYGPLVEGSDRPKRRSRSPEWVAAHVVAEHEAGAARASGIGLAAHPVGPRVLPPVRKLAHDLGVDLNRVEGTGHDGTITREDVLHVVSSTAPAPGAHRPAAAPLRPSHGFPPAVHRPDSAPTHARLAPAAGDRRRPTPTPTDPREVRIPVAGVRKQTAAAMVTSAFTAPHASTSLTVDVTPTTELLEQFRSDRALDGHRITLLAIVAKALTIAVGRNPSLNARWDEDAGEIVEHRYVNLGLAAATPRGLLVPTIKDADRLGLADLADAISALTSAAREGTTTPSDLAGGTITITNIGVLGVDSGTPILVPGQAAILATGAVRRRPWEYRDEIALRDVMTLSLSFDHRLVDGAEAAHFLTDLGAILANPGSVLRMV
ncbi:dihydrolipoamide acetyltransferase component of pyruvate dehydrogenase complex [Cellulomonas chitinilytica]|uniref:Dihydrolipoamide acetyltransferase component of pyruvate dehydrogenase complex n=1 Tax=Cellulomonas chitinilytica TaxID=398759 RepID=A0A919P3L2_9CELL|nr:dihydrolipoamide acetyltransferase family protein [Cellulomonas chitinilytica]GIG22707.1 dihydrolipoamide acetyltransferase component of pyruvate dehydrogenase complex [Cellulomonas chitinilytica]